MNPYSYQHEKLMVARRSLMLPHTMGEAHSIYGAFLACSLAFKDLDESRLDDDARGWVTKLKGFMDTSGIDDPKGEGTFLIKARRLTVDEQRELSDCIDNLAYCFAQGG